MARCLLKDIFLSQGQDMLTSNDGESIRHSLFKLGLQGKMIVGRKLSIWLKRFSW